MSKFPTRLILNGPAAAQMEWHAKHYVGRGLMKRYNNGAELAKDMGLSSEKLKSTFDTYNAGVKAKKDPYGRKVGSLQRYCL
jgi:hypothetical protein